jgi:hypothetical protein
VKDAIIAGVISGLMSPLILAWLSHKIIWKSQKREEIKMNAFIDTLTALSSLETDALDVELQSNKKSYNGLTRIVEFRPETIIIKERARGMVRAFFSKETFEKVDKAMREEISIKNVPNIDFEKSRTLAISALASELGINYNFWEFITRNFTRLKMQDP